MKNVKQLRGQQRAIIVIDVCAAAYYTSEWCVQQPTILASGMCSSLLY
jgi:hypothetical protein